MPASAILPLHDAESVLVQLPDPFIIASFPIFPISVPHVSSIGRYLPDLGKVR